MDIFLFIFVNSVVKFGFACSSVHVLFIVCGDFRRYIIFVIFYVNILNSQQ